MAVSPLVLDEAEVAVVGAGPAGSIAAFTLAERGHSVILIDKHLFPRDKACGDGLTSSAVAFLRELGLEQVLAGGQTIDGVRVFVDWRERESVMMNTSSAGRSSQACCIPREQLDHALVEMACAAGARLIHGYVTQPLRSDGSVVGVELTRGAERLAVHARYVMAADGATSRLRRHMAGRLPPPRAFAYAVRRYVRSDRSLTPSFEVYAPLPSGVMNYGYGWVFPINESVANAGVGYLSTHGLPHPRSINELLDAFLAALQRYHGDRLGNLDPIGRAIGGLFGGDFAAERCQLGGMIFLGDAAQVTDPITGEGIDQAMRSAHVAALTLDRVIRRDAKHIEIGQAIGRANLRLGQDSSMTARLTHVLLKRRTTGQAESAEKSAASGPLLSSAAGMLTADIAHPSLMATPAGELASRLGWRDYLVALDERLREVIHNNFILAAEMLQREVCAGLGPVAALMVIASELAFGSKTGSKSMDAALCLELLSAYPTMLSRVSASGTQYANTNNALAVMIADYSLCRALASAPDLGVEVSEALGDAIEANSEGAALLAHNQPQVVACSVERYLEWARLTSGTNLSLGVRFGAGLAGTSHTAMGALQVAGENLGLAMQICEDILALAGDDPVTGRRPHHTLEEGRFSLPILLAREDPRVDSRLAGRREGAEWDEIIDMIRRGRGLARAAKICKQYADQARKIVVGIGHQDGLLVELCNLPEQQLAPLALLAPKTQRVYS